MSIFVPKNSIKIKNFSKNPLTTLLTNNRIFFTNLVCFTTDQNSNKLTAKKTVRKYKSIEEANLAQIERLLAKRNNRPGLINEGLSYIGERAVNKVTAVFNSLTIENFRLIKFYLYIWVGIFFVNVLLMVISGDIAITLVQPEINAFLNAFFNEKGILSKLKFLYRKTDILTLCLIVLILLRLHEYLELYFFTKFVVVAWGFIKNLMNMREYLFENNFFEIRRILSSTEIQVKVQNVFNKLSIPKESYQEVHNLVSHPTSEIVNWYVELGSRFGDIKVKDFFQQICEKNKELLSKVPEIVADPTINDTLTQIGGIFGMAILSGSFAIMVYSLFK